MSEIKNAAPQILFWGFDDQSGRAAPTIPELIPIHLPWCPTFARKGTLAPKFVAGKAMQDIYGVESFDYRGPYSTHQTPFINGFNQFANIMMMQRLETEDGETAMLRLGVELVSTAVPVYERNADGSYKLDDVTHQPIDTGTTVQGIRGRWVIKELMEGAKPIGEATEEVGGLIVGDDQSTFYPIRDSRASSYGDWGNDTGLAMYPRFTTGLDPVDEELVMDQSAFVYGLKVMTRANKQSTASEWKTISGAKSIQFAFKPGAYNKFSDSELHSDMVFMDSYRDVEEGIEGPFDVDFLYQENIDKVTRMIFEAEVAANPTGFPSDDAFLHMHLANILTGQYIDATPYHAVVFDGMLQGGAEFTVNNIHYATGGDDGEMSNEVFDALVAKQLATFNEGDYLYEDIAKYPFSCFYDSGFTLPTKKLIPRILSVRPDVHVALATQDVSRKANTVDEDSSLAVSIRAACMAFPESLMFGTSTCRAVIVAHSGKMATDMGNYRGMLPGTYELAMKRARYLGSGDGIMKSKWAYDQEETRVIKYMKALTNLDKPQTVRNKDWGRGLTYFQNYDTRRAFHPATRSVYNDDSSILTSEIVMQIGCNVNRVHFEVWRELTGNGKLNDEQFIQKSDEKILQKTNGRYDKRCVIRPETYYTAEARALGFMWLSRAHMYAPNMKTVSAASVVMHRLSDLNAE